MGRNLDRAMSEIAGVLEDQGQLNIRNINPAFKVSTGALLRSFEVDLKGDDYVVSFNSYGVGINNGYQTSLGNTVVGRPFYTDAKNPAVQQANQIEDILNDAVEADLQDAVNNIFI